jgi:hypothetical protein
VATDPTTNRTSEREVTDVIVGHGEKELVGVTVATAAGTAHIVATDGHPFWVDDHGVWLDAGDLGTGDELETAEHGRATVVAMRTWKQVRTVYNLTVDGVHTYCVLAGDTPVLVHNCGGGIPRNADGTFASGAGGESAVTAVGVRRMSTIGRRWVMGTILRSGFPVVFGRMRSTGRIELFVSSSRMHRAMWREQKGS